MILKLGKRRTACRRRDITVPTRTVRIVKWMIIKVEERGKVQFLNHLRGIESEAGIEALEEREVCQGEVTQGGGVLVGKEVLLEGLYL